MGELATKIRAKYPDAYTSLSDAELESKIVARYPGVYDHLVNKAQPQPKADPRQEVIDSMNPLQKGIVGIGAGMYDAYKGVQQLGATIGEKVGLVSPETVKRITKVGEDARADFAPLREQSTAATLGEFIGKAAPYAVMPGGIAGGTAKRLGTSALAGATMGTAEFVPENGSRLSNVLIGGATGGAASGAISAGSKLVNAFRGNVPKTQTALLSEHFGIPTTLGEDIGSTGLQKTETLLERVPSVFGISGFRKKQQAAASDAAKEFLGKYVADPLADNAMESNRKFAGQIFNEVKDLVKDAPQQITPTNTKQIAGNLMERYPDLFKKLQDTRTEGVINDIVHGVKDVDVAASKILGPDGLPAIPQTTTPRTLSFDEAWTLRQGLGEKLAQAKQLLVRGEVDKTAYSQLKQLLGAVSNDIDAWSNQIGKPEIASKFKAANDAYKQYVVKYDVIQRAYDKAAGEVGAGEMFSPKKFSTALKNIAYKDKEMKTFTPAEINEMTGLANILQVVKRAGEYAENPPTGNRWGGLAIGGGAGATAYLTGGLAGTAETVATAVTVTSIAKFLTTTQAGKNLVRAASKIEPNSPAMRRIVNQVNNQLPKFAARGAIDAIQPSMTPMEQQLLTAPQ